MAKGKKHSAEETNGKLRDELLNRELFTGLEDARWVVDRWRLDYNHHRPHSSLHYLTPAEFADRCLASAPKTASATPQHLAPLRQGSGTLNPDPLTSGGPRLG